MLFSRCRKAPLNSSSFYPTLVGEVNTINADTSYLNTDGSTCYHPQNEQKIAVNPTNPNMVVTSANDYRDNFVHCFVYVSTNGGTSWSNIMLPGWDRGWGSSGVMATYPCGGDPVLAYASNPYVQFTGSFTGDYTGGAVDSGRSYFVWTDFRGKPGTTTPNQDTLVRRN